MAFCPVCQEKLRSVASLCPHVAVVARPGLDEVYVGGYPRGRLDIDEDDIREVLTHIGYLSDGSAVYFSPSPRVFLDALTLSEITGLPLPYIYSEIWRREGMEGEEWE
jgi:hypothetical protein